MTRNINCTSYNVKLNFIKFIILQLNKNIQFFSYDRSSELQLFLLII